MDWNFGNAGITFTNVPYTAATAATPVATTYVGNSANANPIPFIVPAWPVTPIVEDEFAWLKRRVDEVINH